MSVKIATNQRLKSKGSILVLTIFLMIAMAVMASAFLTLIPVESQATIRSERIAKGGLVADAGVSEALAWLRYQIAPPDGSPSREPLAGSVYPSQANRTREIGDGWVYRWRLEADPQTFPNGSDTIRGYTIVSRSYFRGEVQREARAQVIQDTFAGNAALYDSWPDNLVMPVRSTSQPAGGPIHVNDPSVSPTNMNGNGPMRLWVSEGATYWTSTGLPQFSHGLTAVGTFASSPDGFAYHQGNWNGTNAEQRPYNTGGPIAARYNRMANGGRDAMIAGAAQQALPTNTFELRDAAWGFEPTTPLPTEPGVYLNEEGGTLSGIYVNGNAHEMELGFGGTQPAGPGVVSYGENSWVKIEVPYDAPSDRAAMAIDSHQAVTVVTIEEEPVILPAGAQVNGSTLGSPTTFGSGTTLLRRPDGTFEHFGSPLNGSVYVDGTVECVWGINKGRRTIAVASDDTTTNDIVIGGKRNDTNPNAANSFSIAAGQKGLIQFGATDEDGDGVLDAPTTADHTLGLVADNVRVSARLKHGGNWATSHPQTNPLYIYATVMAGISDEDGGYGVDAYDTGGAGWSYRYGARIMRRGAAWGTTSGHGLVNGNTYFDEPASVSPPPYFPSLPRFIVKSYEEIVVNDGETL